MLVIKHPPNRAAERAYIFDVLFGEFLGLEFVSIPEARNDIKISFHGIDSELRIADVLFQTAESDWLQPQSHPKLPLEQWQLPDEILQSADVRIENVPVLFRKGIGSDSLFDCEKSSISLGLDILGSAFFMLTRYEEVCAGFPDEHGRFPARDSLAVRAGFIERPIVNEYFEILWACLYKLCPALSRVRREYEFMVSHDVDRIFDTYNRSWPTVTRNAIGDIVKRREPRLAAKRIYSKLTSGAGNYRSEPCNSFDFIMDTSERNNIRSAFYFIPHKGPGGMDGDYELDTPWVRHLLRNIDIRGHELGLHASYSSYNDPAKIAFERLHLQTVMSDEGVSQEIRGGRQHYLRWEACTTWQGWEDAGMEYDSTLTFPEAAGFRSGACFEYPTFNLCSRNALKLRERPLVVMETSLFSKNYMNLSARDALDLVAKVSATCRRFNGQFTMLWHNDNLVETRQKRAYFEALEAST